ncbi:MAG TPA: LysR family transcriptional regulator [Steroidobacteraceae bacterium]|nr:LysR family transcriptional regulator [Steroidobacteraceae bacterium]
MHTIDPRHLITLEAVARHGSFAAAAEELACTQSAVSQQIAEIERRIGIRVLDRRPVRVTAAGRVLLDAELAVRTATAIALQELSALSEGRTGHVRLGAFASAAVSVVPRALARFRQTHPDVHVKLAQLETEVSYAQILRGDLDLALTFDYDRAPRKPPGRIRRSLVVRDPVLVVLPAVHRLAGRAKIRLAELAHEPWIGSPVIERPLELLAELCRTPGFKQRLEFEGDDFQTVLGLVDQGLGIALLPKLVTLMASSRVVAKPIAESPLTRFIYTARLETRDAPASLAEFEQALAATVRRTLA